MLVGLGFFVGTFPSTLRMFPGCIAFFVWLLMAVLGMVLCTSWLRVPGFLALLGILWFLAGLSLFCRFCITWLGHISISKLPFVMPGRPRSPLTCAGGRDFREGLCLTLLVPVSSFMPDMLEKGTRLCSEASWLGVFGMDFFSAMPGENSFRAVFAAALMVMGIFFGECSHQPFGLNL